jgi:hypothetical protein
VSTRRASGVGACKQEGSIDDTGSLLPRSFFAGQISRAQADRARTIAAFNTARDEIGQRLRADPDNGLLRGILCVINAGLGRREEALSERNRAVELRPISQDAVDGPVTFDPSRHRLCLAGRERCGDRTINLSGQGSERPPLRSTQVRSRLDVASRRCTVWKNCRRASATFDPALNEIMVL